MGQSSTKTSTSPPTPVPIVVFVPHHDRCGDEIDYLSWRERWAALLSSRFGNAEVHPDESLRTSGPDGFLVDHMTLVSTEANPGAVTAAALAELGDAARRFGHETGQVEVGIWVSGVYHAFTSFE